MKRLATIAALLLIAGFGCTPNAPSVPSAANIVEPAPEDTSPRPPEIVVKSGSATLHGVGGSYCYQGTCADTISPVDLLAGKPTQAIPDRSLTVHFGVDATDVSVDLLTKEGGPACSMTAVATDPRTYTATLCGVPAGSYILQVGTQFSGGDEVYVFPVSFDFPIVTTAFGAAATLSSGAPGVFEDGLIAFLGPITDSRCQPNVQCIWQGELSPTIILSGGSLPASQEITLGTVKQTQVTAGPYTVTLFAATETTATISITKQQ